MEVIAQQAIGERIHGGLHMLEIQAQKEDVIARFAKQVFAVVAAIVNVIAHAGLQGL
jgi:hypothetical protein